MEGAGEGAGARERGAQIPRRASFSGTVGVRGPCLYSLFPAIDLRLTFPVPKSTLRSWELRPRAFPVAARPTRMTCSEISSTRLPRVERRRTENIRESRPVNKSGLWEIRLAGRIYGP